MTYLRYAKVIQVENGQKATLCRKMYNVALFVSITYNIRKVAENPQTCYQSSIATCYLWRFYRVIDRKKIREIIGYTHQEQLGNADIWYKKSISFHEAYIVLEEHKEHINDVKIILYNAALSLELIFKAILAVKKEVITPTHKLSDLCINAGIQLDEDQKYTLDILTACIVWLARYPSPNKKEDWDSYHDNVFESCLVRSQSGNTQSALVNNKRFPTMENYMRIWEICLVKYNSIKS